MSVTQTVEIPANRRLVIDVPREIPSGQVILTFTPIAETGAIEFSNASYEDVMAAGDEIIDKHIGAFKALAQ